MTSMNRRAFVTGLGAVLAAPFPAKAQTTGKTSRVGFLTCGPSAPQRAFIARLAELGYRDGENVEILLRFHGGIQSRAAALASDLVALKPEVIVAVAPPSAYAVQKLTTTIPIVFVSVARPVETGLVTNLIRPGANITGLSLDVTAEITTKQLQLLRDLLQPHQAIRLVMLWNPDMRGIAEYVQETERWARATGIKLQSSPVRDAAGLEVAIPQAASQGNHGLVALPDQMTFVHRQRLAALAAMHRLPAIYPFREFVDDGGLMSYGPDLQQLGRRAADYVDKILKGVRPGDLPVEQPTKFEFVINLKTAKTLGLTIPPSLLLRADHVIE